MPKLLFFQEKPVFPGCQTVFGFRQPVGIAALSGFQAGEMLAKTAMSESSAGVRSCIPLLSL